MGTLSNIKVVPHKVYWNSVDLGYTEGDITISWGESTLVDVKSHQEGATVLDQIATGRAVSELTVTLKEFSTATMTLIKSGMVSETTPAGGTEVIGVGDGYKFQGLKQFAKKLYFQPVGATDHAQDWFAWMAVPVLDNVVLSGENPVNFAVKFKIFKDSTAPAGLEYFGFGDHTQTFA